jgi:hypothetical protein
MNVTIYRNGERVVIRAEIHSPGEEGYKCREIVFETAEDLFRTVINAPELK